jgi:glycosyltransferase involved in cell wall biosynthesis
MPKVTIITPTFNSERFIEQTILSIRQQSYPCIEHIIVDGGSTDRTLEIVRGYPEIRVISEPDEGIYDALNKGLRLARGDILAYLNSDDLYTPNAVEIAVESFKKWSELELIYGDCYRVDEQGKILYKYRSAPFDWDLFVSRRGLLISQPTAFWRRHIHEKYGFFDKNYKLSGDYDFFMRVFAGKEVRHCGCIIAMFRIHPDAMSQKLLHDMKLETQRIWNKWEKARQVSNKNKNIFLKSLMHRMLNWRVMLTMSYWRAFYIKHLSS